MGLNYQMVSDQLGSCVCVSENESSRQRVRYSGLKCPGTKVQRNALWCIPVWCVNQREWKSCDTICWLHILIVILLRKAAADTASAQRIARILPEFSRIPKDICHLEGRESIKKGIWCQICCCKRVLCYKPLNNSFSPHTLCRSKERERSPLPECPPNIALELLFCRVQNWNRRCAKVKKKAIGTDLNLILLEMVGNVIIRFLLNVLNGFLF